MNAISTKVLLRFFRPFCPFAPSMYSQVTPRHVLHSEPHISCQVRCYIPLYTHNIFKTCITWTQNMPMHDKMKKMGQMGRLEKKIRNCTFVLIAFISFGQFNIFRQKCSKLALSFLALTPSVKWP
jgi:hypothetical protein